MSPHPDKEHAPAGANHGHSADAWWSVRLTLEENEAGPMSSILTWPISPVLRAMSIGGLARDGFNEAPFMNFELHAPDAGTAERRAHEIVAHIRREVKLPERRLPVAWVAPLEESDVSSQRFLDQAKDLFDDESFDLAVVAAQVHFELQVRTLLRRAAERTSGRWAERLMRQRGYATLTTDFSKAALEVLLGVDPTQTPEWPEYAAHVTRRNGIVHEGQAVGRMEAGRSIAAVEKLWARLTVVARQAEAG